MTQDLLPIDEVSQRLKIGVLQVYDLFNELNNLFRLMHRMLRESEADIHPLASRGFRLPMSRKSKPADRFMKTDMGLLAEIGAVDEDGEDEEGGVDPDELDDEAEDSVDGDRAYTAITPERRFLGVRAILLDPKDKALEPTVVAGVFGSLTLMPKNGRNAISTAESSFNLRRASLKRLVKLLEPELAGRTLSHKVKQGELAWTVTALHSAPLASFGSKADLDAFVQQTTVLVGGGVAIGGGVGN